MHATYDMLRNMQPYRCSFCCFGQRSSVDGSAAAGGAAASEARSLTAYVEINFLPIRQDVHSAALASDDHWAAGGAAASVIAVIFIHTVSSMRRWYRIRRCLRKNARECSEAKPLRGGGSLASAAKEASEASKYAT
jgi:hypothetical protein